MTVFEALTTRRSPMRLAEPAPPAEALEAAFAAALNAPDHGRLKPWKFIQISGAARQAFGQVMAAAAKQRNPAASEGELKREADKAMRAPLLVVMAATPKIGHKVPVVEQVVSAGCAVQNFILALHEKGFGCQWKTGAPAYDASVKAALGLAETDQIVGIIYAGSVMSPGPAAPQANVADFLSTWQQPVGE